jgi:hypothetical protein
MWLRAECTHSFDLRIFITSCLCRFAIFFFRWNSGREGAACLHQAFKLGKSAAKTHQMIKQAFGDDSLSQTQNCDWFNRFKNGQTSVDDDEHSGRPFSILMELSISNSCLQVRLSMRSSTATSWGGFGRTWGGSGQANGARTTGCSITTMHPRTPLWLCSTFWPPKTWWSSPTPPYSPDLAPCDFFLFPKIKIKLKGRRFDTVEEIQAESQKVLNMLTQKDFQDSFQSWQKRWDRCVRSQGDHFEGDGGD